MTTTTEQPTTDKEPERPAPIAFAAVEIPGKGIVCGHAVEHSPAATGIYHSLATLPPNAPLTEAALANLLGKSRRSITRAVERGELPPPVRLLGQPTWLARTITAHLAQRLQTEKRKADHEAKRLAVYRPSNN